MRIRITLIAALCLALAAEMMAEDPRYVVILAPTATMGDTEALATRLARTYGGTVESVDGPVITLRVSPSRAALLGRDPNVLSIATAAVPQRIASDAWNAGVSYEYDGSGNVKKIGTDTFSYDVVGRLVEAHTGGVKRQYEYDAFGNRTKCTDANGAACQDSETISATSNRSSAMTYNAGGDVIAHAGHTYTFDEFHMLTSDKYGDLTREFIYDADDRRVGVLTSAPTGSWWRWTFRDPLTGKVLREFTSEGIAGTSGWKWQKDYIWRDGLLLATVQPNSTGTGTTTYHYHLDHLGTTRRITDDNDVIVGVHDYHAFGPEASGGSTERSLSLMKYTGHERDIVDAHPDSLDYMMARYYSPTLGRFLSVDPVLDVKQATSTPQAWNRYAYVRNNPVRFTDPTGKYTCEGSRQDCATIRNAYNDMRQASRNLPANSAERTRLNNALAFLGRPGQANGVRVTVGSGTIAGAAGGTSTTVHRAAVGPTGYTTQIGLNLTNIATALRGRNQPAFAPEVAGALAHEAGHGMHQRQIGGMPSNRQQALAGEVEAFTNNAAVYRGLNFESGWQVWTRANGFDPQAVQRAAEQATQDWCNAGGNCQ